MKRIFLDTNFIIDYLLRDEYKNSCVEFLAFCAQHKKKLLLSFLSVANFAYIARKEPQEILERHIAQIVDLFDVVPNTSYHLLSALEIHPKDFEDGIQYQTAIGNNCDCIISRNKKDFMFSSIPVLSSQEFLDQYRTY